ncbi:hypothetical protein ABN239_04095 [Providencia vermicola]|uniref:hypothetical protein n=1 Tax=Morganellaceae TaxID=1903414 RepID=UPI0018C697A6|nr:hypothetical protein [Proteus terrae]MBG3092283.1 hypothetical protein [Proteus terrae subsp. cibarius]
MNNLSELNELWSKLSADEKIKFINSKIEYNDNVQVSLESISGNESLKMNFGSVFVCSKCGK